MTKMAKAIDYCFVGGHSVHRSEGPSKESRDMVFATDDNCAEVVYFRLGGKSCVLLCV